MVTMTKEEALIRFKAAKEQKRKTTEHIVKRMVEEYEQETGKKPQYIEIW